MLQAENNYGVIASSHGLATQAGEKILKEGGNAFDAMVTVSLVTGLTECYHSGIGGGAIINYKRENNPPIVLQARGISPKQIKRELFLKNNKPQYNLVNEGPLSILTPGLLAGLYNLWEQYGKLKWEKLVEPATKIAREGFIVDKFLSKYYNSSSVKNKLAKYGNLPFISNSKYKNGDLIRQIDMAKTLDIIAKNGARIFYDGIIADKIVKHIQSLGGLLNFDDLKNYKPISQTPLMTTYRNWKIFVPPFPSLGGSQILLVLNILEQFPVSKLGYGSSDYFHLLAETIKSSFIIRSKASDQGINKNMLTKEYSSQFKNIFNNDKVLDVNSDLFKQNNIGQGTSHFCIIDKDNNVVSITQTIRDLWGSGIVIPGTGITMNNLIADFNLKPKEKTTQGVLYGQGNLLKPEQTPGSNTSPIIAHNEITDDIIAIGGGGGPMIISGVIQALINHIDFDMSLIESIHAPRIHCQGKTLEIEGWIGSDTYNKLISKGHKVHILNKNDSLRWSGGFYEREEKTCYTRRMPNIVQFIKFNKNSQEAAADPRGPGSGVSIYNTSSECKSEFYGYNFK